jgi:hypothetical protein
MPRRCLALILLAVLSSSSVFAKPLTPEKCRAGTLKVAGKKAANLFKLYGKALTSPDDAVLAAGLAKAEASFDAGIEKLVSSSNACTLQQTSAELSAHINQCVASVRDFVDMVYVAQPITTVLGDAVLDGALAVDDVDSDIVTGEVRVTYGTGGAAIVPTPGGLNIAVGPLSVVITNDTAATVLVDGQEVAVENLIDLVATEAQSGADPSQWAREAQAIFALLALTSTDAWRANLEVSAASDGTRARALPRSAGRPDWRCKASAAVTSTVIAVAGTVGCAALFTGCAAGTVVLDGLTISCVYGGAICGALVGSGAKGVYDFIVGLCTPACEPRSLLSCYSGPTNTQRVGACHDGTQVCKDDGSGYGPCLGQVVPTPAEVCGNGVDDNCNGLPDSTECTSQGGTTFPDTGQTTVFRAGDDGTYFSGCQPSYTDNGDGTVTDNCTGLLWEQSVNPQALTWPRAIDYCEALTVAGHSDWRLPNIRELASIIDYGTFYPAMNTAFQFPDYAWDSWSGTSGATDSATAWYITFGEGGAREQDKATAKRAHCVVGVSVTLPDTRSSLEAYPGDDTYYNSGCQPSYTDNGDGTVNDNCTGLMWETADSFEYWTSGIDRCTGLVLGGHSDWRLPNIRELTSIIDYGRANPPLDPIFVAPSQYDMWSSSSRLADSGGSAWFVYFTSTGVVDAVGKGQGNTRCVRGGL